VNLYPIHDYGEQLEFMLFFQEIAAKYGRSIKNQIAKRTIFHAPLVERNLHVGSKGSIPPLSILGD
jgi:hypothetical protein